jgi:hypothetical protein
MATDHRSPEPSESVLAGGSPLRIRNAHDIDRLYLIILYFGPLFLLSYLSIISNYISSLVSDQRWVKNTYRDANLQVTKLSEKDFLRTLENAIRFAEEYLFLV